MNNGESSSFQRTTRQTVVSETFQSVAGVSAMSSPPESSQLVDGGSRRRFKSYRLKGEYEKPWLGDPAVKKTRWNNAIVGAFIVLGFALAAVACFFMVWPYRSPEHCLIYEDNFETLDRAVWSHEVQLDGFGSGAFDWTTTDEANSYVDAEGLHIVPTLTNETTPITNDDLFANYTLDLLRDGSCTSTRNSSCIVRSDPIEGNMVPPVRSARLSTKGNKSIRYGKVEVVAKLPVGDWLWPAIWMMPEDSVYGDWPRSGEIDIMESRGNGRDYPEGGRNYHYGTLHWGPSSETNSYWRTTGAKMIRRGDLSQGYHTYGIQWTPEYIYFYVDSRVHQILFIGFHSDQPMYERGRFADLSVNQTLLANPWASSNSTTGNAPFDQKFYLILNVAVGSRNGWFLDNVGQKPWLDGSTNAQWNFWNAASEWLPTWGEGDSRGMTVKSVKMWQAGACGASPEL
ncbi:putative secreted glucosidase [Stachybotrys elegans]|uniref:Secreted glucosidase n=1 Tax=Stachybotrys elegans TaxID=80388 RepID=A0A8K0SS07_9HYPO|nr:putative secreted glucosidase [Stachybotrys elegans]